MADKEPPIYIGKKEPLDNYPNYEIDKEEKKEENKKKGKAVKQILKSRLKRYNDPSEIKKEEIVDKDYLFEVRKKEELSPIKYKKKDSNQLFLIYNEILNQMKNLLNWEKQFKAIDLFRKCLVHHLNLLKSNKKYFYDLINALLQLSCSNRSLLAKNALVAFEDIFEPKLETAFPTFLIAELPPALPTILEATPSPTIPAPTPAPPVTLATVFIVCPNPIKLINCSLPEFAETFPPMNLFTTCEPVSKKVPQPIYIRDLVTKS